jgi:hypothetical protein
MRRQFQVWLPYILAYKLRNFGHFLTNIFSIRLICGSETMLPKMVEIDFFNIIQLNNHSKHKIFLSNFGRFLANIFSIQLIRGSTCMRVYTVPLFPLIAIIWVTNFIAVWRCQIICLQMLFSLPIKTTIIKATLTVVPFLVHNEFS